MQLKAPRNIGRLQQPLTGAILVVAAYPNCTNAGFSKPFGSSYSRTTGAGGTENRQFSCEELEQRKHYCNQTAQSCNPGFEAQPSATTMPIQDDIKKRNQIWLCPAQTSSFFHGDTHNDERAASDGQTWLRDRFFALAFHANTDDCSSWQKFDRNLAGAIAR